MEEPGKEGKSHELDATSLPAVGVDKSWGVAKVGVESSEFSEPVKEKHILDSDIESDSNGKWSFYNGFSQIWTLNG